MIRLAHHQGQYSQLIGLGDFTKVWQHRNTIRNKVFAEHDEQLRQQAGVQIAAQKVVKSNGRNVLKSQKTNSLKTLYVRLVKDLTFSHANRSLGSLKFFQVLKKAADVNGIAGPSDLIALFS